MYKFLLIFVIFFSILPHSYAQQQEFEYTDSALLIGDEPDPGNTGDMIEEEFSEINIPDTTLITGVVNISSDSIRNLKNRKAFSYLRNIDSLLKAKQSEGMVSPRNRARSVSLFERLLNAPFLQILFWLIAGVFIIFIAVKLLSTHGIFRRSSYKSRVELLPDEENMNTHSDYNKLIHQSCLLGDYRSAVKYLFLRTLQVLSEHSYIEYSTEKTNYRYLQEIAPGKKNAFSRLVMNYEYIWYGKMQLEREIYEKLEKEYTAFQNEIVNR